MKYTCISKKLLNLRFLILRCDQKSIISALSGLEFRNPHCPSLAEFKIRLSGSCGSWLLHHFIKLSLIDATSHARRYFQRKCSDEFHVPTVQNITSIFWNAIHTEFQTGFKRKKNVRLRQLSATPTRHEFNRFQCRCFPYLSPITFYSSLPSYMSYIQFWHLIQ